MCKWGTDVEVTLAHPMPVSGRTVIAVDACIAPLIQALNDYGVHTVGCCCGHGNGPGIVLYEKDGQQHELVLHAAQASKPNVRAIVQALGFDPTNHHNALACPYCNPDRLTLAAEPPAESVAAIQQHRQFDAEAVARATFPDHIDSHGKGHWIDRKAGEPTASAASSQGGEVAEDV